MKLAVVWLGIGLAWMVSGQPLEISDEARVAADRWLAALDTRDGRGTWEMAGREFQEAIAVEAWEKVVAELPAEERQFGGRRLIAAHFTRELPGGVRGQFVIFQFRRGREAGWEETLIVSLQIDGQWRVAAYQVGERQESGDREIGR
ncbi:MAG: DUF4019 domain-containing protein [Verrucomicrobiia bacterium]